MSSRTPQEPSRYDQVRSKLVEKGYLQGRIERFVLRDLPAPGRGVRRVAGAGARAALLGGPALGALLAATTALVNRPLLGALDALVLWIYSTVLCAVVLFALDLAAAGVVALLARRRGARPRDALRGAILVGAPTLAYLVALWWRRQHPVFSVGGDLAFLAGAALVTLLVARLGGLVSLAGLLGATGDVPQRVRRVVLAAGLVVVPVGIALVLGWMIGRDAGGPRPASFFQPAPGADRVVVVGVDGLDAGLFQALADRRAAPRILAAMESGSVFPLHREPGEPPRVWTTLMTGMPPSVHGVLGAGAERLPGVATPLRGERGPLAVVAALRYLLPARTVPASGAGRTVRTVWEIAGLKVPVAAVGWWASWPAETPPAGGYVVSDRVLAKLRSGAAADRDTAPRELFEELRKRFPEDRAAIEKAAEERFDGVATEPERGWVRQSFLIDAYRCRVLNRLLGRSEVRAGFVYLPGLDILRQRLLGGGSRQDAARAIRAERALEAYVRWLDDAVGSLVEPVEGRRAVLVADPGRGGGRGAEGFVLAGGGGAKPGCVGRPLRDLDVAPLILTRLGFPSSKEMPGRDRFWCLASPDARPPRIATYGRRPLPAGEPASDYDQELVDRLRSLGYLQ